MPHTPGPWTVHAWGDNSYEVNAADSTVCNVPGFHDGTAEEGLSEHNARLIAAAPELLAACQAVANDCDRILSGDDFSGMSDADLFRAFLDTLDPVITKARGRADADSED